MRRRRHGPAASRFSARRILLAAPAAGSTGGELLELYCGNGNFTVALAPNFRKASSRATPSPFHDTQQAGQGVGQPPPPTLPQRLYLAPHLLVVSLHPSAPILGLLPLQVVATEVSKSSVAAAKRNFELNGVGNVFVARMSSEEFTAAWKEGRQMRR